MEASFVIRSFWIVPIHQPASVDAEEELVVVRRSGCFPRPAIKAVVSTGRGGCPSRTVKIWQGIAVVVCQRVNAARLCRAESIFRHGLVLFEPNIARFQNKAPVL